MSAVIQARELSRWYGIVMGLNNVSFEIARPHRFGRPQWRRQEHPHPDHHRPASAQLRPSSPSSVRRPGTTRGSSNASGSAPKAKPCRRTGCRAVGLAEGPRCSGRPGPQHPPRPAAKRYSTGSDWPREHWSKRMGHFSKGMKQRVKLAQGLLHEPDLLVLDEPMNGLDPMGRQEMARLLKDLRRRRRHHPHLEATSSPNWNRSPRTSSSSTGAASWPPAASRKSAPTSRIGPKNYPSSADSPEKLARHLFDAGVLLGFDFKAADGLLRYPRQGCRRLLRPLDRPAPGQRGDRLCAPQPEPFVERHIRQSDHLTCPWLTPSNLSAARSAARRPARAPGVAARPSRRAARVWLLTWKSQLAWRQAPILLGGLWRCPVLIYITTPTSEGLVSNAFPVRRPADASPRLYTALGRLRLPLQAGTRGPIAPDFHRRVRARARKDLPQTEGLRSNPDGKKRNSETATGASGSASNPCWTRANSPVSRISSSAGSWKLNGAHPGWLGRPPGPSTIG